MDNPWSRRCQECGNATIKLEPVAERTQHASKRLIKTCFEDVCRDRGGVTGFYAVLGDAT